MSRLTFLLLGACAVTPSRTDLPRPAPPVAAGARPAPEPGPVATARLIESWQVMCSGQPGPAGEKACKVEALAVLPDGGILVGGSYLGHVRLGDVWLRPQARATALLAVVEPDGRVRWHRERGRTEHNLFDYARPLDDDRVLVGGWRSPNFDPSLRDMKTTPNTEWSAGQSFIAMVDGRGDFTWMRDVRDLACENTCPPDERWALGEMVAGAGDTTHLTALLRDDYKGGAPLRRRVVVTLDGRGTPIARRADSTPEALHIRSTTLAADGSIQYLRAEPGRSLTLVRDRDGRKTETVLATLAPKQMIHWTQVIAEPDGRTFVFAEYTRLTDPDVPASLVFGATVFAVSPDGQVRWSTPAIPELREEKPQLVQLVHDGAAVHVLVSYKQPFALADVPLPSSLAATSNHDPRAVAMLTLDDVSGAPRAVTLVDPRATGCAEAYVFGTDTPVFPVAGGLVLGGRLTSVQPAEGCRDRAALQHSLIAAYRFEPSTK